MRWNLIALPLILALGCYMPNAFAEHRSRSQEQAPALVLPSSPEQRVSPIPTSPAPHGNLQLAKRD